MLLFLLLFSLVLHVVARLLRVDVAEESCQLRPWLPTHWREPIEEGEEIQFFSRDGVVLSGTYLHRLTDQSRGTIVFSHELNGDRWNALAYVEHLRVEGFEVFTFDYRSHGRSESPRQWDDVFEVTGDDVADLQAAIHVAVARSSQQDPAVGLVGVGKGAAIALCTAIEEPTVRALLLDSIRPVPGAVDSNRAVRKSGDWRRWIKRLIRRSVAKAVDVTEAAKAVKAPVLFVHGRQDAYVSLDAVRTLASQVASSCQLWIVPGARHAEAVQVDKSAYSRRSLRFLNHALRSRPVASEQATDVAPAPVAHSGRVSSAPAQ